MNTPFSDYTKPAYYYRLFHEGRPKPKVFDFQIDDRMPRFIFGEDGWKQAKAVLDSHQGVNPDYINVPSTSPVDPLADVW